ncbi:MAG: electron transport complex subunit RsxB [Burkholderiales bacterium]|nr:electron transport complex subunit RsxB [Burkholderiales bacterium]
MNEGTLAETIDGLLPQTQCTKCGYSGCLPYARAIAAGKADINQCPPGGAAGIKKLASLLGREAKPLDTDRCTEQVRAVALIDEARCIGCTLCIQACPVDAIVGAPKLMHTVIAGLCTGCDLCLPPCPVDCIEMLPLPEAESRWTPAMAQAARARYRFRGERLARELVERSERLARKAQEKLGEAIPEGKKAVILAALERARARRTGNAPVRVAAGSGARNASGKKP